jgi:YHS domain-containing protein
MPQHQHQQHSAPSSASPAVFTAEMVVNKKDFICEMPVSAGISDTCHIDGKAYGFCSHECMLEFKADPAKYLSAK